VASILAAKKYCKIVVAGLFSKGKRDAVPYVGVIRIQQASGIIPTCCLFPEGFPSF